MLGHATLHDYLLGSGVSSPGRSVFEGACEESLPECFSKANPSPTCMQILLASRVLLQMSRMLAFRDWQDLSLENSFFSPFDNPYNAPAYKIPYKTPCKEFKS